ncbi:MAG: hypothetical protein KC964_18405 [Candidatus Omnitrophica bacterium]|nr:hypothetical protein [Candidatus Omnitrophota bacterium]
MDDPRVNLDLILIQQGYHEDGTWTWDEFGHPNFIKIRGAFKLTEGRFNLDYCNLLSPVPTNIYDLAGNGRFHFYKYVYVDEALRIRSNFLGWRRINRGYDHNLHAYDNLPMENGWQWICYENRFCGAKDNILSLIYSVQGFLYNDA